MTDGIDISNIQGARFGWGLWKGEITFGAAKATEGTGFTDPDFGANWDAMWWMNPAHTFPRFAYHFFHATLDPAQQAGVFVATVKRHGLLPGDNFMLDLESTIPGGQLNDGLTPEQCAARAVECLHAVNDLAPGHRVLPYMNPSWARAGGSAGMGSWFLWLAEYGVTTPQVPPPWDRWTFWQRGGSPIDTDVFNGTRPELLAFTRMPARR
jgi:GH25 family lysozyme M1 (1,4-beta-N-acetylmuramidase)